MNRHRLTCVVPAAALLLALGCHHSCPPPPADPVRAREALEMALDAWKAGKAVDALEECTPAIHVVDHEWRAGLRLVAYRVEKEEPHGADLRCQVTLTLRNQRGEAVQKKAVYSVGTEPALTVVRGDDH